MKKYWQWHQFKKIGIFLTAGVTALIIACVVIEHDPWVHRVVQQSFEHVFAQAYEATFRGRVTKVGILGGYITLEDCFVTDEHEEPWHWRAKNMRIRWSWWEALRRGIFALHVEIDGIHAVSSMSLSHGKLDMPLLDHVFLYLAPSTLAIPCTLKSCTFSQGEFEGYIAGKQERICSDFSCFVGVEEGCHITLAITHGTVIAQKKKLLQGIQGKFFLSLPTLRPFDPTDIYATASFRGELAGMPYPQAECKVFGKCEGTSFQVKVRNSDDTLQGDCQGDWQLLAGNLCIRIPGLSDQVLTINGVPLTGLQVTGEKKVKDPVWTCSCICDTQKRSHTLMTLIYNQQKKSCTVQAGLDQEVTTSLGTIQAGKATLSGLIDHSSSWQGFVELGVKDKKNILHSFCARILSEKEGYLCRVVEKETENCLECRWDKKRWYPASGNYMQAGEEILKWYIDSEKGWCCECSCAVLARIQSWLGIPFLAGEGTVETSIASHHESITGNMALRDACLLQAQSSLILKSLNASFQAVPTTQVCYITDMQGELARGMFASTASCIRYKNLLSPTFAYFPLTFHDCFVQWRKTLFAQVSGYIIGTGTMPNNPMLRGYVVLDRSYLKGNIFSQAVQKELLRAHAPPVAGSLFVMPELDIRLVTNNPIEVKTSFLRAGVTCDLHLIGKADQPRYEGCLTLVDGELLFPYQSLRIKKGEIRFVADSPDDPEILVIAQNTIKGYTIELRITGTGSNPKLTFSSHPHLDQEQIITLLLGGSEDGSLFLIMPGVVSQILEHIILGGEESTRAHQYLRSLFKPFQHFRLIPKLTNQSGRGGLRGALAIEVGDRVRAQLEKNFSFSEDTTFEAEYDITDDMCLRGIKDERGDIGAELEVRWKL